MNDDDIVSDDFLGSRTIELDKLPVNQEISRSVRINEVGKNDKINFERHIFPLTSFING